MIKSIITSLKSRFPYNLVPRLFLKPRAKRMAESIWGSKKTEIFTAYQQTVNDYETELARRKEKWETDETSRIARLQGVIDGDLEAMHATAASVVESIPFPFHTSCDVYLDEMSTIFVNLDLPEKEDVIPTHKNDLLKSGDITEIPFAETERNRDYFGLVVGQSILIAADLFATLPTLKLVRIAGFTQRPRTREADEIDTYVYDITYPKEFIWTFDVEVEDFRPLVRSLAPIMSIRNNWALERIERPSWIPPEEVEARR